MSTVRISEHTGRLFGQFVKSLARGRGDPIVAERVARAQGWTQAADAIKAITTAVDMDDAAANGMLAVQADLVALLRPQTILGRMLAPRPLPFRTRILRQDVGGAGDWVGEGQPIPVTAAGLSDTLALEPRKVAGIRVITEEWARASVAGSDQLVGLDAAGALIEALDTAFISPNNGGSDLKPRSVTHPDSGAVRYESSGATLAAIDADLKRLVKALTDQRMSLASAQWVLAPETAATLALMRGTGGALAYPNVTAKGGNLLGLPLLTSSQVTASGSPDERYIALIESSEVVVADEGQATIETSTRAALQMDDAPSDGAQQLVSLWHLGLVGIKATREISWDVRRDGAVAVLDSVTY